MDGITRIRARFRSLSQTIHRETTSEDSDLEAFVVRVGGEPEHVAVDGPEAVGG